MAVLNDAGGSTDTRQYRILLVATCIEVSLKGRLPEATTRKRPTIYITHHIFTPRSHTKKGTKGDNP